MKLEFTNLEPNSKISIKIEKEGFEQLVLEGIVVTDDAIFNVSQQKIIKP